MNVISFSENNAMENNESIDETNYLLDEELLDMIFDKPLKTKIDEQLRYGPSVTLFKINSPLDTIYTRELIMTNYPDYQITFSNSDVWIIAYFKKR